MRIRSFCLGFLLLSCAAVPVRAAASASPDESYAAGYEAVDLRGSYDLG